MPYVQQLEAADCGAACLAMVLAYFGHSTTLDQVRAAAGSGAGTDAAAIVRGAEQFGLRGRGVRIQLSDLRYLPVGSILHWDFNHFVVLDRVGRNNVEIVDPAFGRRSVPIEHFSRHFTGVALSFEMLDAFVATPPNKSKAWRYLAKLFSQPALVTRLLIASITLRVLALALPVLTAMIVDRVVPRGDQTLLFVIGAGVVVVLAFQGFAALIRGHILLELSTKLDTRMTFGFLSHLLSLPYAFFTRRSAGDLLMRIGSNTQIRELLTSSLLSTLLDGTLAIAYLVLLIIFSPLLAALTFGAAMLQVAVLALSGRRFAQLAAQDLATQSRAQSYLTQMLVGIETLKVAGAEDRALEHWANLYVDQLNVSLSRSRMMAVLDAINGVLQTGAPLMLLGGGTLLVLNGQLSLGTMLATIALAAGFLGPISTLMNSVLHLQMLGSYVERIDDVLAAAPEQKSGLVAPPRLSGRIEVNQVSFRYGPNDPLVVRDITLAVEPGSTIAIVGRSGSGKSTLAALLVGLHKPSEGRIVYDGYDLCELDHKLLRQQLGMVPQAPFIFAGSIRSNIALTNPSLPLVQVVAAARKACIDVDIRAMAMSYETIVADGGATLSGGQRQRLALARALIHDPAVLLLDEATSSLDSTTERDVMRNLNKHRATRIVIAHRLSTIASADQIIVMHNGRIVETGTHDQLVRNAGTYSTLVADQTFKESTP